MKKKVNEVPVAEKWLCNGCVGEKFLKDEIRKAGEVGVCSYCGKKRKGASINDVADEFEGAFERHFFRTSTEPNDYEYLLLKGESSYEFERHGEPVLYVIQEIGEVSEKVAEDILEVLGERHDDYEAAEMGEESEFDSDSHYAVKKSRFAELHSQWRDFQTSLRTESRYFNNTAESFLNDVFRELGEDGTKDGGTVIVDAGPKTSLTAIYRARVFQNESTLEKALKRPDLELASPPFRLAKAGRMNAHGISLFYGALDRSVAIAEVRPPVGSRVMTGEFRLLRQLKLLDLEALRSLEVVGSYFDPHYLSSIQRANFLGFLGQEMAKPVMPDDEQFSYLPTQVIADFLANGIVHLDGIIYPSVQVKEGMQNIVLFHDAAKVKEFVIPATMEISTNATLDPEHDTSYWVFESSDGSAAKKVRKSKVQRAQPGSEEQDYRDATLELNVESVEVHHVSGVAFHVDSVKVHRHASTRSGLPEF